MCNKKLNIIILILFWAVFLRAQDNYTISQNYIVYKKIVNGDTIYISNIKEVIISPTPKFSSRADYRRFQKLIRNVKKVYPYAKMAGVKYRIVEEHLLSLKTERERKAYIKEVEKEIVSEYEDDLSQLTITQGRILLKLIDREIGLTSYDLLKDLKGSFSAVFWQTLARIFGHNLKSEFDPAGEDKQLNEILILIDNGQL
jgi:hypothetical protein